MDGLSGNRCVVIDGLELPFFIGIYDHEKTSRQTVRISLKLFVPESGPAESTDIVDYVSYADVVDGIKALAESERHTLLVETLAEDIASLALSDKRVARVIVDVRKTEIIPEAEGVGVMIERKQRA